MTVKYIDDLLAARHTTILEWYEPWKGCDTDGGTVDVHVTIRATVHDCINMQRLAEKLNNITITGYDETDLDRMRLSDFMSVHWAIVIND